MEKTIVGSTFDLLRYDGSGNFGKFDRVFSKVSAYFQISANPEIYRRLRNLTFHYLRTTGYIDVSVTSSSTRWSTSPSVLVEQNPGEYIFVGPTDEFENYKSELPDNTSLIRQDAYRPDGAGASTFLPPLLKLSCSSKQAQELATKFGHNFTSNYQQKLFANLPTIETVRKSSLIALDDLPLFEEQSAERFDFQRQCWEEFRDTRPDSPGLYKRSFEFSPPEYLLTKSLGRMLATYRILDKEWAMLLALDELGRTQFISHNSNTKVLSFSRIHSTLRIPTLLERAFRSGSLTGPTVDGGVFSYQNIHQQSILKLIGKLPIFKLERR